MRDWLYRLGFDRWQWFRRWCGGHWEQWYVDGVQAEIWYHVERCYRIGGIRQFDLRLYSLDDWIERYTEFTGRPTPLCRGTPLCEDW